MAEIPVITITGSQQKEPKEFFTRVFCLRKETPPLGLLVEYLKGRGATPIIPAEVNEKLLNSWNWVGIEIGYAKGRKPILVTCVRKGGAQDEVFKQDIDGLLNYVEAHRWAGGPAAQWIEHKPPELGATGSNPVRRAISWLLADPSWWAVSSVGRAAES